MFTCVFDPFPCRSCSVYTAGIGCGAPTPPTNCLRLAANAVTKVAEGRYANSGRWSDREIIDAWGTERAGSGGNQAGTVAGSESAAALHDRGASCVRSVCDGGAASRAILSPYL